jgi:hypothetical protein
VPGRDRPDFIFPSAWRRQPRSPPAAAQAKIAIAQSSPFYTPMVIASWLQPIAKILVANGMARRSATAPHGVDIASSPRHAGQERWRT